VGSFRYTAKTRGGERREGTVEAGDRRGAMQALARQGLVPISISDAGGAPAAAKAAKSAPAGGAKRPAKPAAKSAGGAAKSGKTARAGNGGGGGTDAAPAKRRGRPRLKPAQLLMLTGELVDLLSSGMTIGAALHALSHRRTGKAQDAIVPALRDEIVGGSSLSAAMAKWPESFPPLYVNMVKVGEASGQLPAVLARLAAHYERMQGAREKVSMALVYPAIVALVGVGAIIFMMVAVIPQFTKMFEELGGTLPLSTRMMIGMSKGLLKYGWLLALAIAGAVVLFRGFLRTPAGVAWKDRTALRVPVVGGIVRAGAFSNFAHTLGTLLANGMQMFPALAIVEDTVGNGVISAAIRETRDRVADGSSLSRPLSQNGVFPQMLTDMLAVGEETGDMTTALDHIGKRYDAELDRAVKLLTTLMEPLMMLLIALGVGFVAISMISAVFEMTNGIQ